MKPSKNRWLMSFTDLITLILGFFVMMYSAKSQDIATWETFRESTQSFFNNKGRISEHEDDIATNKLNTKKNYGLNYFENSFRSLQMENRTMRNLFSIEKGRNYVGVTFAYANPENKELLYKFADLLNGKKNRVEIEAHEYSQENSINISKKIIDFLKINGLNKNIPIKLNQEIFLPETNDIKNKTGLVSVRIFADEESI